MKNLFRHPVALQIICMMLGIFLVYTVEQNIFYKELMTDTLEGQLEDAIVELESMNRDLIAIYMTGSIDDELSIETDCIYRLDRIDKMLDGILNIHHYPFSWHDLIRVNWRIRDMKEKKILSEEDLAYISDVHQMNQQLLENYNELLDEYGIEDYFKYDEEKYVVPIYKAFIKKANELAETENYQALKDYEVQVEGVDQADQNKRPLIYTEGEAKELATSFLEKIIGEPVKLTLNETKGYIGEYEFENYWGDGRETDKYHISVSKYEKELSTFLRIRLGEGTFNENIIDGYAKEFFDKMVPENYVLYERKVENKRSRTEEITYKLIAYNDVYYDEGQVMDISIDNYGALDNFSWKFEDEIQIIPPLVPESVIRNSITSGKVENVILVVDEHRTFNYEAVVVINEIPYTLSFDAMTGEQLDIMSTGGLYYNRVLLDN